MSTTRYLDFDSTYRNRNCYPCPSDFKVNITCSKLINGNTANDFVSNDYPNYSWYQLPYAGFDLNTLVSYNVPIGNNGKEIKENIIKNGRLINGILYTSLWPVSWNNGTNAIYSTPFTNYTVPQTGAFGTRFKIETIPSAKDDNFWNDLVIRNQNISCPQQFSGGTNEQPQLGFMAQQQAIVNNYFTGAMLFKFKHNPISDMINFIPTTDSGGNIAKPVEDRPPIGSLGMAFYYQKLFFKDSPPRPLNIGDKVTQDTTVGYIACIINDKEILVRMGNIDPFKITDKWYPPWKSDYNDDTVFDTSFSSFDIVNTININDSDVYITASVPLAWGIPLTTNPVFQTYLYCGNVESSIITKYDKNTTTASLKSPFSDFNPGIGVDIYDYYLIDFNTDPSSYWENIQGGAPRIFFPTGADIENYYTGTELSDVDILKNKKTNAFSNAIVKTYNSNRRTLFLEKKFNIVNPKLYCKDTYSSYTILYLETPLEKKIPVGSMIFIDITSTLQREMNYVAVESPEGSSSIILNGISENNSRLLDVKEGDEIQYILTPPYYDKELYEFWKNYNIGVCNGSIPLKTYSDGDDLGCISFGSRIGSSSIIQRNQGTSSNQINIPYTPYISTPVSLSPSFFIRNNCVFEIELINPGINYTITPKDKPILALLGIPSSYTPPYEGWKPLPEKITSKNRTLNGNPVEIYTFLNICFVNIESVDKDGSIIKLSVNSPGSGYPRNSTVHILDGLGTDIENQEEAVQTWIPGYGSGASGIIKNSYQTIGVPGSPANFNLPKIGDAVYIPTYGWTREGRNIYNSSPTYGDFYINYNIENNNSDFIVTASELPTTIQNCLNNDETYPETGVRIIQDSFESSNSQVLINTIYSKDICNPTDLDTYPIMGQYSAPACYLNNRIENNRICDVNKSNKIIWIGIRQGYDIININNGKYALAKDEFVNYDYAWGYPDIINPANIPIPPNMNANCCEDNSGGFFDHIKRNPSILNYPSSAAANVLQIIRFTKDNEETLNYSGSTVSQNQMVCYEIELLSLILPNLPLNNTIGGLIAFYPYVYVELSNVSDPNAGIKGVLYSNNPNARRALFKVGITDTPTPLTSSFIKVDGNRSVQTVKFKPNDTLHIRVYLSNGDLFQTLIQDNAPPLEPNPFVQISSTFSIKRLV